MRWLRWVFRLEAANHKIRRFRTVRECRIMGNFAPLESLILAAESETRPYPIERFSKRIAAAPGNKCVQYLALGMTNGIDRRQALALTVPDASQQQGGAQHLAATRSCTLGQANSDNKDSTDEQSRHVGV